MTPVSWRRLKATAMIPAQCRAARAMLDMTQQELAEAAGLELRLVADFERGRGHAPAVIQAARRALERAGIEFVDGGAPGVRLKPQPMEFFRPDQLTSENDD